MIRYLLITITLAILTGACQTNKWTETDVGNIRIVSNKGGPTLGYSVNSGITLIYENGFAFKDLNKKRETR
jgi:beta-glucosidase